MKRTGRALSAFTLIELLAVIAIIAILAGMLFPYLLGASARAKKSTCLSNLRQWGQGLTMYLAEHEGIFPEEGMETGGLQLPKSNAWFNALPPYLGQETLFSMCDHDRAPQPPKDRSLFSCPALKPSDVGTGLQPWIPVFSYGYNLWIDHSRRAEENPGGKTGFETLLRLSQIRKPSRFAVFGEVATNNFDNMCGFHLVYRHADNNAVNIVLADGHVQTFAKSEVYVDPGAAGAKSKNRGVIWNPEGDPDQNDPSW